MSKHIGSNFDDFLEEGGAFTGTLTANGTKSVMAKAYEDGYRDGYNIGHKDGVEVGRCAKERAGKLVHDSDGEGHEDWLHKDACEQSPTSD